MFYRLIAKHTRDHINDHLAEYLALAAENQDAPIKLPMPKRFDVASYVGGVVGLTMDDPKSFPALALDVMTRTFSPTDENFYTFRYDGQITGMIGGANPDQVERIAKGYMTAIDLFCNAHTYTPISDTLDVSGLPFSFLEFGNIRSQHFGAAEATQEEGKSVKSWVDGFVVELAWTISEPGVGQHG